ncbi:MULTISPECIES: phosphonate metabolism transcriptional regulator PhnF [unclassified Chelatococcus]|uniref:phosphonate metabolism transcriptional regulator PhnF n=1 Tax=unclassified Chelatococcus TaxID=2638111 RepID=UPI001BD02A50|nr:MULTISPECIES: phosphonate metabolism transcriptional regulator PhnF [unclassified Chelatococcus]CAH1657088.1 Transcriptional regulator PhnF [Hyphomicrobiales bacterium]MBS7742360.1 phosphonate metabolism transcriptional regulator PhnF [Chelatococcus sp. HY11]MBX3542522.1 phosphonate metabolism transcriptional regulator PhnF [Chelatococcus sp.]MCO5075261.1 phosphonate metabolism transcriptional regulator PhnF [Chelatococcus sp.]CAH1695957.1 Transcriptional regulator PhnF [Hyphomicrobiales ba
MVLSEKRREARRIADTLAARIASGELRTGNRLPTQAELAAQFSVNRHAIRRAIELLEQRGLARGRQGSGVYVTGPLIDYYVKSRTRYNDNVRALARDSRMELIDLQERRASPELARDLAMKRGGRVFDLHILRWTGHDPLCVARHLFSADRYPQLPERFVEASGITDLIGRLGVEDFRRSDTAISARQPTAAEARMLHIPHDSPVVVLEGRNVDLHGVPVEISTSVWPATRIKVHV